ncbi:MAG: chloride channel protein [Maritimibacter sp.]
MQSVHNDQLLPGDPDQRFVGMGSLSFLAVVIGIVTGLGAIALRYLISIIHNLFFLGTWSSDFDANLPTPPSPYGPLVILAPVIGGLIVLWMVRSFAPEAKGHGVPEVMDAIYYKRGKIRPRVVIVKSLASALSIGSGASVGREGPIIQIGSGIGSVLGQLLRLRTWQIITLVAAGAGAGIAATFNTPLGAVLFAVELMLPEFSARTLIPVVVATGTATYIGRLAFGLAPAFLVATHDRPELFVPLSVDMLPLYVIFGVITGLAALAFVRGLYKVEDLFDGWDLNPYLKNIAGMLSLGILMYVLMLTTGMYHTAGVGYASIEAILTGQLTAPLLLLLLFGLKFMATSVSLGAGASGGIFSPSLFLGASLGGAFGGFLELAFPHLGFHAVTFALIGMAGIVGASTGAALTAIMMLFEMTGDYSITVAAILAVVVALAVRQRLSDADIYTLKLVRRGHGIPRGSRSHMFGIRHVDQVMLPVTAVIEKQALGTQGVVETELGEGRKYAVVTDGKSAEAICRVNPEDPSTRHGPVSSPVGYVRETSFLQDAMSKMADRELAALLVVPEGVRPKPENVTGVLTRDAIAAVVLRDYRN